MSLSVHTRPSDGPAEESGPATSVRVALRRGVFCTTLPDGQVRLMAWPHAQSVGVLGGWGAAVLAQLAQGPHQIDALVRSVDETDSAARSDLRRLIGTLESGGWLARTVFAGDRPLYTVEPLRPPPPRSEHSEPTGSAERLSRFAMVHRDSASPAVLLESPRSWCEIRIHDGEVLTLIGLSALGDSAEEGFSTGLDPGVVGIVLADLRRAAMLVPDPGEENTRLSLRQWSPHELLFHDRSRLAYRGHVGDGFGGTWWARGLFDPPPARPAAFAGPAIPLHRPDLDRLRDTDPSFTSVLEGRHSVRRHDASSPISAAELGEFLYRSARIRRMRVEDGVEFISRPHASGGSVYEQEVYPVVTRVAGLEPGMYHYDGHDHQLNLVQPREHPAVRRMLQVAAQASTLGELPQVLLVISARVGRVLWKYEGMGYSVVLRNTGALYQTLSLVASAMGLAGCGLGTDDAAAFTEATNRDQFEECSVGQFILGSMVPA
jgi:SagB-type dehydrogenase family enzyme